MSTLMRKTQWMCAGLLLALTSGTPALADDTEILLVNPNAANPPQPNLLFIIDTSGSMGDLVETRLQYDTTRPYDPDASCDPNMLYWTLIDSVPTCDAGNTQFISKATFACNHATARLTNIGSYSGTMVQFRGDGAGSAAWQPILPGESIGIVECAKDSGVHGIGASPGIEPFAQKGSTLVAYTADGDQEIEWIGNGVSDAVTVYDGNYLNYRVTPELVDDAKLDIVKDVVTTVLKSIEDVNVGIMRFNSIAGGPVIQAVVDLDDNRTEILDTIAALTDFNNTPLSETLYESARYWRGMAAFYGEDIDDFPTDDDALRQLDPELYKQPAMTECTKNYNILMTDGLPVDDADPPGEVANLTNWSDALDGRVGCLGAGEGHCLDDIAEYLFKEDLNTTIDNEQLVTTHTIGFDIDLDILEDAATASGGQYFLADDVESLTIAMLKIVSIVQDRSLSFSAPAVAVNSFNRTRNLNSLYLTTFGARGKVHWPGNLKKYAISGGQVVDANGDAAVNAVSGFFEDNAQSFWSAGPDGKIVETGGAANELPAPGSRNIFTYNGTDSNLTAGINRVETSNSAAFTLADFGLTGAATEPDVDEMILWARGADQADEDDDSDLTEPRNQMGDPLHSQPAAVVYGGTPANPDTVIFSATNDGYLHAINGATGAELWSFIPKEHMTAFSELYFNLDSKVKNYGIDGDITPVIKDVDNDGIIESGDGDFVYILFGMRRGGENYYALNVTNKTSPQLLWKYSHPNIGQSWSTPAVARVKMDVGTTQNADHAVVILGGGYDPAHDTISYPAADDNWGAGVYMLDLVTGNLLWRASADPAAQLTRAQMKRAIPSAIRVIDLNGNGFADRMYASDLGGQIWRFDIFPEKDPNGIGPDALVTGGVIAQLGVEGNLPASDQKNRRFYSSPDVSLFNDNVQNRRFIALSIGSGYRAHPLDNTTAERFYSIRDRFIFQKLTQLEYNAKTPIKEALLVDISGSVGTTIGTNKAGWMFTLPANQKVLTESTTFNNEIFFVAFSPDPDATAPATCAAGVGRNFLYRVSVVNGDPIADLDNVVAGTEDSLRVTNLKQGGIASSPRFLFPTPDATVCAAGGDCTPPPLGCIGVECFDPGFANNPVRTLWTQDGIE